jgi:hypothetical protein
MLTREMSVYVAFAVTGSAPNTTELCGVWPKYGQGSKRNKSNCRFLRNLTFDWLVDNPDQGLFGRTPQYER